MNEFLQLLSIIVPVTAIIVVALVQNKKMQEIHVLVNSQLSNVTLQLTQALARIGQLENIINGLNKNAGE